MAKIEFLIIHCTATPEGREVSKRDLIQWHKVENGWDRLGYSDIIHLDGGLESLTDWNQDEVITNQEMTWGVRGKNSVARHVVYSGGVERGNIRPKDTRTDQQKVSLEAYVKFHILRYPLIKVAGHNQFASKACPSFDVPIWLKSIGVRDENIF